MRQQYPHSVQKFNSHNGPNWFIRILWFVFVGSWLGLGWLTVGYLLCLTIIGLPIGLLMLNRLPAVLTLRPASQQTVVGYNPHSGHYAVAHLGGVQHSIIVRALYFGLIGWWFGFLWCCVAYFLCALIIPLPLGVLMFDRLPAVLTLRRN